jgi:hypothetical protein
LGHDSGAFVLSFSFASLSSSLAKAYLCLL